MEAIQAPAVTASEHTADTTPKVPSARFVSIDAFRAVTLLLMIFVNDFGYLRGIPQWLKHAEAADDALGFSDVIFPAFLFIVGLSIPIAIQNRLKRDPSVQGTTLHILWRSLALLIMGFFHVNLGSYSSEALLSRPVWEILITVGFFLIWLDYPKGGKANVRTALQLAGVALLVGLAAVYKGAAANGTVWMTPKWWGILGLIGWSYLLGSLVFLWTRGKAILQVVAFLFFLAFNSATHAGWLDSLSALREYIWIVGDGSMPAMVMAGILTTQLYLSSSGDRKRFFFYTSAAAIVLIAFGFLTRPIWEISKIRATPSWTAICTGISLLCFAGIAYITDVRGKVKWYNLIRPAGVSTLTCYLIPYLHDAFLGMVSYRLPLYLRSGMVGLAKSMAFSLLIILVVGLLQKARIRLKL